MKKLWLGAFALLLLFTSINAWAWGYQVHRVIANIAQERLTPRAERRVKNLLALEDYTRLASIASWADHSAPRKTKRWHYVNFQDSSCSFQEKINCPDGQCVVDAVKKQITILGDRKASDKTRLTALKYVVHLVGDIHQPLHDGIADDSGGNKYHIKSPYRARNLHAFWDTDLYILAEVDEYDLLTHMKTASFSPKELEFNPVRIAENNCKRINKSGFYPAYRIEMSYVKQEKSLLLNRIELSGARLAQILNQTLGY